MQIGFRTISAVILLVLGLSPAAADETFSGKTERVMSALGWMSAQAGIWRAELDANPNQPDDLQLLIHTLSFAAVRPCDTDLYLYLNQEGKLAFSTANIEWQLPVVHGLQHDRDVDDQAQQLADVLRQQDNNAYAHGRDFIHKMPYWRFFEKVAAAKCGRRHGSDR